MTAAGNRDTMFQPANGVRARWYYAYDLVAASQPGDSITYEQLAEALGMSYQPGDAWTRAILCQAMDTARARLESERLNTVSTKEKFGWIVLDATGALRQVERRLSKTVRAAVRCGRGLGSAHREQLTQADRQARDFIASNLVRAADLMGGRRRAVFAALERESQQRKEIEGR